MGVDTYQNIKNDVGYSPNVVGNHISRSYVNDIGIGPGASTVPGPGNRHRSCQNERITERRHHHIVRHKMFECHRTVVTTQERYHNSRTEQERPLDPVSDHPPPKDYVIDQQDDILEGILHHRHSGPRVIDTSLSSSASFLGFSISVVGGDRRRRQ